MSREARPWFRCYVDIVDDDKLRLLAFEDRWHFVAVLAMKKSGLLDQPQADPTSDLRERRIAVKLGLSLHAADEVRRRLMDVALVDEDWQPLKWDERQYEYASDSSTDRVRRFRERKAAAAAAAAAAASPGEAETAGNASCNVTCNAESVSVSVVTPRSNLGTGSEDGTYAREGEVIEAKPLTPDATFATFWQGYPRRVAKAAARRAWGKAHPHLDAIMRDLERRAAAGEWSDPRYIPHPATYLNQRRWEDEPEYPAEGGLVLPLAGGGDGFQRAPRRTRDIPLHEDLTRTDWANGPSTFAPGQGGTA